GFQYALRQLPRLADGDSTSQSHSSRYRTDQLEPYGFELGPQEHDTGRRLSDSPLHARAARRRRAPETDRVSRQGTGQFGYRRRADVSRGPVTFGPASDHEPAGVST